MLVAHLRAVRMYPKTIINLTIYNIIFIVIVVIAAEKKNIYYMYVYYAFSRPNADLSRLYNDINVIRIILYE